MPRPLPIACFTILEIIFHLMYLLKTVYQLAQYTYSPPSMESRIELGVSVAFAYPVCARLDTIAQQTIERVEAYKSS